MIGMGPCKVRVSQGPEPFGHDTQYPLDDYLSGLVRHP